MTPQQAIDKLKAEMPASCQFSFECTHMFSTFTDDESETDNWEIRISDNRHVLKRLVGLGFNDSLESAVSSAIATAKEWEGKE